ncbi:SpoIIE family protein phosphatase [Actinomadura sediminis]|uniref:SpoIIE family protein phosphatase n=1 Tax=Actinomadura sediminis TaxID=1038904 RepID=A0ABW3ETZ0_9ACTN
MSDADAVETTRRPLPPRPDSPALARRFVRGRLAGKVPPDTVDTAVLVISELVTNAVLHARTGIQVAVRAVGGGVHARVTDRAPHRGLVPGRRHPYTDTGRGLYVIERLTDRYGVDTGERGKTVWFELGDPRAPAPAPSGWGPPDPPDGARRTVTLADVPWELCMADRQHRHAILRELLLAAASGDPLGVGPDALHTAHDANNMLSACLAAADRGPDADIRTVALSVPADAAPALGTLRDVLDAAEDATRTEALLSRPALPQSTALQKWLLDEVIGQLDEDRPPTAWTVASRDPTPLPWDADQVRESRLPTVATDDRNRITAVNEAAADLLGWDAGDLVGRRLTVLIPEHLRDRHIAAFTSLLLTGRPRILGRPVPLPALHRDGSTVPVRLLIQSQEKDDGRTVFVAHLIPRTTASPPEAPDGGDTRWPEEPREPARRARRPTMDLSPIERLSLLTDSERALSSAQDLVQGLRQVGRMLTRRLVDWCAVDLLDEHGEVERVLVVHHDPALPSPAAYEGRFPPLTHTARGPLARALRGAGPLVLTDATAYGDGPLDARYAELFDRLGAGKAVITPLRARRDVLGAVTLGRLSPDLPTQAELEFVQDLAHGIALGVENARLYDQARKVAERLQQSLLPPLPAAEHLELAARYAPSTITAQAGGDWYDGFVLPNGDLALAIGDVAGHDIDATATMSRLSGMLRGAAVVCREPPEEVLHHLDIANRLLAEEATATCIYAVVKGAGADCVLVHSSAGHPPPLLTTPDGATRYLDGGSGLMLGTGVDLPRPSARTPLPPHSTVLLYTDGLIERRDEPIDASLQRLREHAGALARAPLGVFCDELLIRLGADGTDDIALIALRPTP